ncbi:hypothetical protein AMTR_s00021p00187050 [Amborella trichopoda]|uniref:Uncharacterized protein n=1 Tax=Amborella trichopoda TaxID=13333 RepID=W1PZX3_AMBTC|nr:hypothetical protein AMTR_s00021p00187050 [Amborella trichopoda]
MEAPSLDLVAFSSPVVTPSETIAPVVDDSRGYDNGSPVQAGYHYELFEKSKVDRTTRAVGGRWGRMGLYWRMLMILLS